MKHVSKYFAGLLLLSMASSCSLKKDPYSAIPDNDILKDETKWPAATAGNYALLKEENFTRNYFQMGEFPSDDVTLSGATTDPLFYSYTYGHLTNQGNALQIWRMGYKTINGCNRLLEVMSEGKSDAVNEMIGENLFIRAFVHFSLVRTFGRPYSQSPETNLGIPVITKYDITALPKRNTVKEVYAQIVADLSRAKNLMDNSNTNSYATKSAAMALLARTYLYMGKNDSARIYADSVITSNKYSLVATSDLPGYYTKSNENNKETIFAIHHTLQDDRTWSSIGSMYYMSPGGMGYGEMYASGSYLKLLHQHPEDVRNAFVQIVPMKDQNGKDSLNPVTGEKVAAERNGVPKWYILKYSNQDNVPTLSSPVVLRLAEMYLIRAEANAKLGNNPAAISDVNIIRARAGLSGASLFSALDLKGYASVLDVVLDERRLELAFETHRVFDLFRNNRDVFRDYKGVQPANPQTIKYTDASVVHFIPEQEILLDPNLVQNPLQ
ncbi:SusD-like starch-binding protein associating with outer membrane [Chitinophaga niastensis]|uniref:SusD-like starch-binding protein associating with outer membrane n=1 Tax=Chitinophaga niastensis TaxID=536980 RepID=A0A2P8HSI7_CHINA|nr:RagB/SusD family nutrient uptake outer membrane protein [Chitinophaga niastensis]PSL49173.1 SusD-like starch-binding protein associating with outer membrane [Chitinophaga niastensis]